MEHKTHSLVSRLFSGLKLQSKLTSVIGTLNPFNEEKKVDIFLFKPIYSLPLRYRVSDSKDKDVGTVCNN